MGARKVLWLMKKVRTFADAIKKLRRLRAAGGTTGGNTGGTTGGNTGGSTGGNTGGDGGDDSGDQN